MIEPRKHRYPDIFDTAEEEEWVARMLFQDVFDGRFIPEWSHYPKSEEIRYDKKSLVRKFPNMNSLVFRLPDINSGKAKRTKTRGIKKITCEIESAGSFGTWNVRIFHYFSYPNPGPEWNEFDEISGNITAFQAYLKKEFPY